MKKQHRRRFVLLAALFCFLCHYSSVFAGPNDGSHDFSLDSDNALNGVDGDIYVSSEGGQTPNFDFNIAHTNQYDFEIDALSGVHDAHDVPLDVVIEGIFRLLLSVDNDSNIYEWEIFGSSCCDDERSGAYKHIHDTATDLGLSNYDLDALESHEHPRYPIPFPGVPYDWEDQIVYYSLERTNGQADEGDIFYGNTSSWGNLYLDDSKFANAVGFDEKYDQIDALIVYDIAGSKESFDSGGNCFNSDFILFSLAPRQDGIDPIGDNIYWYSAIGKGGLYFDPGLTVNVDALDNHPVPEPSSILLFGAGAIGLLGSRKKKQLD